MFATVPVTSPLALAAAALPFWDALLASVLGILGACAVFYLCYRSGAWFAKGSLHVVMPFVCGVLWATRGAESAAAVFGLATVGLLGFELRNKPWRRVIPKNVLMVFAGAVAKQWVIQKLTLRFGPPEFWF